MAETGPWDGVTASAPKAGSADDGPWNDFGRSGADGPWNDFGRSGTSEKPTDGSMSWGDMALKAAENAPSSALKFGKDLVQPIMHPIETAKSLGRVALGTVEKAIPGGEYSHEKYADAVGHYFKDRYGGLENVKRSFAEDPVGVLSDASMALTGGGSAAARLPGMLGRAGEIAGTVGRTIDPVMAPVNAAKVGSELVGGFGTHTGSGPLKEAYRAGVEGGEKGDVFRQEMRGNADMSDVVDTAREGMSGLYEQKARQYNQDMGSVKANNAVLNFDGVDQAMARAEKVKKFGTEDIQKKTGAIRQEIADQIEHWRNLDPAEYHTPAGFDALKQSIGDIMDHTEFGSPARRVAREAYNAVKQEIVKQAPEYAKAMSNYESAMGLIREMEKTLSLKQGANIDTTLRKLQSIMRNNVNANYGRRLELGQMLEESGAQNLMARLAGQTLNTWTPRGLGKAAAEIGLLGAGAHAAAFPWAAAALPAMSPRLMGEAAHLAGRTVGRGLNATGSALGKVGMGNRGVGDLSYELGRTANESNRASGGAVQRAIRASKGYAEGGAPELSDDDQAAMMPESYVNPLVKGMGTATGNVVKGLSRDIPRAAKWFYEQAKQPDEQAQAQVRAGLGNAAQDLISLPERAIRSADVYQRTGEYDPGPILEAATLPMGTGAIAGVPLKGSEHVLGAGLVRKTANKLSNEIKEGAALGTAGKETGLDVARDVAGASGGTGGLEEAQAAAARHAGAYEPLEGLPRGPFPVGGEPYVPGPIASVHDVARDYMASTGRPYVRADRYHPVDPEKGAAIARAFDEMKHAPDDPKVKESYNAMIKETRDQYDAAKRSGVVFEPIPADMPDPYAATPRLAAKDVQENNHLWYYPTEQGYGTSAQGGIDMKTHPMLQPSGRKDITGKEMLNNDLFRVVHDYFGHLKEGNGFRAAGEDNAWRTHANMYSDLAKPAMTTETRGQNSWVNYGPHGEANRSASAANTVYADQKVGVMPDWVVKDLSGPEKKAAPRSGIFDPNTGLPVKGKAYSATAKDVLQDIAAGPKGAGPLDLTSQAMVPDVPQRALERYDPPRGISPRLQEALQSKEVKSAIEGSVKAGMKIGADKWYHTEPVRRAFSNVLGEEKGNAAFGQYMDMVAATSPRSDVPTNIRNASFYYGHGQNASDLPSSLPYPYGHVAQNLHRQNYETLMSAPRAGVGADVPMGTAWDIFKNPKPASFAENLRGNLAPVTVDTHAFRNIAMRTGDPRFLETSISQLYKPGVDRAADSLVQRYGEVKGDKVIFRPQKLLKEGKLSIEDAKKIPTFWASKPNENEYGAAEKLYSSIAGRRRIAPADAQAAAWAGAGDLTGLGTVPTHTFPELFNERVLFTSKMRGEHPQETLEHFISGRKPLLNKGGAVKRDGGAVMRAIVASRRGYSPR